ncbi:hypothetical protein QQS21_005808 [Conoideocrella luteorostrata]|uniref:FAD-binding domain-containing protein n=1 Tax=Conoideocrella luteorostrata TaxID=1105319 RepID=A0AAJ0CNU1_9HYPO|nr:hypothetical protein QQS21_005808 [Conoideocrella luteorostrata]
MDSPAKKPLRVLISGAGIAGPALAFWLGRLGHSCTIIERFSKLRAKGQQIDIRRQGVEAAQRMDILEEIRKRSVDEAGMQFVNSSGKPFAVFPKLEMKPGEDRGQQGFSSEFEIMRGDLCELLVEKTKGTAEYKFGLSVTGFENAADHVRVTFSDGTSNTYDMLVAADGQGSRIRKMLLKDEDASVDYSRDLGVYMAYFSIPREPEDVGMASIHVSPGERMIFTRFHSETQGQGYLCTMAHGEKIKEVLKQDIDKQKELFADIFKDVGWQSGRLIDAMQNSEDFYALSSTQIRTKVWSKGRVVCLGDAGYGPTSLTGMGTSLALIGAYILAGEISLSPDNAQQAFTAYERVLRPYVEKVQQIPKGMPNLAYPKKQWGVKILQLLLSATTTLKLDKAFQTRLVNRETWKLPEYPAMEI